MKAQALGPKLVPERKVLYQSRLLLDPAAARNPYEIHQCLWSAFPGRPEAARPFLFRVEWGGQVVRVAMQSTVAPAAPERLACRLEETRPFRLDLRAGVCHRFRLCANPAKRDFHSRARVPLASQADQLAWLRRRLAPAGAVLEASLCATRKLAFRKKRRRGCITAVDFAGVLQVTDTEALERLVRNGVGPAKSFGCGLLLLGSA